MLHSPAKSKKKDFGQRLCEIAAQSEEDEALEEEGVESQHNSRKGEIPGSRAKKGSAGAENEPAVHGKIEDRAAYTGGDVGSRGREAESRAEEAKEAVIEDKACGRGSREAEHLEEGLTFFLL